MARPRIQHERLQSVGLESGRIYDVALHPTRPLVACATGEGRVFVVDVEAGEVIHKLKGHHEAVLAVSWRKNGAHLVSTGRDTTIRVWDTDSGAFLVDLNGVVTGPQRKTLRGQMMIESRPGHSSAVTALDVSSADVMASGGNDALVKIWHGDEVRRTFDWHAAEITVLVFATHDPTLLLTAGRDGVIRIWDADTGAMRDRYMYHGDEIEAVAWVGSEYFASADLSGALAIWEVARDKPVREVTLPAAARCCFGWDERVLLVGLQNGDVTGIDCRAPRRMKDPTIETIEAHDFAVRCMHADPERNLLVSGGDEGTVTGWTIEVG